MSGIEDEVVPRDHMQALWEIVLRRGQSAEEKEKERGKDTERERGEDKEGDPDKLPKWMTETSGGDKNEGQSWKSWEDTRTGCRYVEFEAGMHSELNLSLCLPRDARCGGDVYQTLTRFFIFADDTCVQPGYWAFVASFVRDVTTPRESPSGSSSSSE